MTLAPGSTFPGPELVALAGDQLALSPDGRLRALLAAEDLDACLRALAAAAQVADVAVLVGPVAAALAGAPQRPGRGRVDLLYRAGDLGAIGDRWLPAGVLPDGLERPRGRRGHPSAVERRPRASHDAQRGAGCRCRWRPRPRTRGGGRRRDRPRRAVRRPLGDRRRLALARGSRVPHRAASASRASRIAAGATTGPGRARLTAVKAGHVALLGVFIEHGVRFVLVGGVALQSHGFAGGTVDVDLTVAVDEQNNVRIDAALHAVRGRLEQPGEFGLTYATAWAPRVAAPHARGPSRLPSAGSDQIRPVFSIGARGMPGTRFFPVSGPLVVLATRDRIESSTTRRYGLSSLQA